MYGMEAGLLSPPAYRSNNIIKRPIHIIAVVTVCVGSPFAIFLLHKCIMHQGKLQEQLPPEFISRADLITETCIEAGVIFVAGGTHNIGTAGQAGNANNAG